MAKCDVVDDDPIELLRRVAETPPGSLDEAHRLEKRLSESHHLPGIDEFLVALALYEPTSVPETHLVGYDGLRLAAAEALHELGRHEHCLHDTPLMDRP